MVEHEDENDEDTLTSIFSDQESKSIIFEGLTFEALKLNGPSELSSFTFCPS